MIHPPPPKPPPRKGSRGWLIRALGAVLVGFGCAVVFGGGWRGIAMAVTLIVAINLYEEGFRRDR